MKLPLSMNHHARLVAGNTRESAAVRPGHPPQRQRDDACRSIELALLIVAPRSALEQVSGDGAEPDDARLVASAEPKLEPGGRQRLRSCSERAQTGPASTSARVRAFPAA
jgi:hypothetical protein